MWKISVLGCFLLITTVVKNSSGSELPAGIEKCIYGETLCLVEQSNNVFKNYPHGNAELSVPDLNPLEFDSLAINQDSSKSVTLNLKMKDTKVMEFNTVRFYNATPVQANDWNNTVFTFWASCPIMNIISNYTIQGKILVLPIEGSGDLQFKMTNSQFVIKIKIITHKKDGKTYATVEKLKIKTGAENMQIQMNNLFNGDKTLGDNLNKVLNENWRIIWDEVEPGVDAAFAEIMQKVMNGFFKTHPLEDIFIFQK